MDVDDEGEEGSTEYKRMRDKVLDELKNVFRPEMLNRLDEIVCFRQLERSSVARIARIMLKETAGRMRSKGMEMALTQSAMNKLLAAGYDKEYGAHPLRRAITSIIDDNLSEAMLKGVISVGDTAVVDFDEAAEEFGVVSAGFGGGVGGGAEDVSVSANTYLGVSVVAVRGNPAVGYGLDVAWSSMGLALEGAEEELLTPGGVAGRMNNSVSRRGPVPANDVAA